MQHGILEQGTSLANLDKPTAAKLTAARSLQEFTLSQEKETLMERIKPCEVLLAFEADQRPLAALMRWRKLQSGLLLEPPEEVAISSNPSMTKRCIVTKSLFRELLLWAKGSATLGEAPRDTFGAQERCRHHW